VALETGPIFPDQQWLTTAAAPRPNHTRLFALTVFTLFLFAAPVSAEHVALERLMVALGNLFIVGGGLIRVYAALFIGGWKNQRLAAVGPYAMTRNPLYVGSLFATLAWAS
jgi:protein-S-isoprenylcysteine O-methyltransferase Ste14